MDGSNFVLPSVQELQAALEPSPFTVKRMQLLQGAENPVSGEHSQFLAKTVPKLAALALQCHELFAGPPLHLLVAGKQASVTFTSQQIACLMSIAFFGLLKKQGHKESSNRPLRAHFRVLFGQGVLWPFFESYFEAIAAQKRWKSRLITVERIVLAEEWFPEWEASEECVDTMKTRISLHEPMESSTCRHHSNFANMRLSGHLFGGAVAQEEILMATRPELIVAAIFAETLQKNEAVTVAGTKLFSHAHGYGRRVTRVPLGALESRRKDVIIVCIDAEYGAVGKNQGEIDRDINKAWAGLRGAHSWSHGRWGAGMFAKSPELTFVQSWLAAVERRLTRFDYACFDHADEKDQIEAFLKSVQGKTVQRIYRRLLSYASLENRPSVSLLSHLMEA